MRISGGAFLSTVHPKTVQEELNQILRFFGTTHDAFHNFFM
jgi:hypothetical protein